MILDIFQWIIEPLQYGFMQRALLVGLSVSVVCALLSCFLVLKGWALMGDAIAHAVVPGIILAFIAGIPLIIGAFISGLSCSLLTGYIKDHSRLKHDAVLGIVFSGMFALGLVLFVEIETDKHLLHILFGNMLGITDSSMWQAAGISVVTGIIILLKHKDFMLYCFDSSHARVSGLNIRFLKNMLLVMLALTIVAAVQVVGVVMVEAMLVGPGIIGLVLTQRFSSMLKIAVCAASLSTFFGVIISYHLDGGTSSCIVLSQAALFIIALAVKGVSRQRNIKRIKQTVSAEKTLV